MKFFSKMLAVASLALVSSPAFAADLQRFDAVEMASPAYAEPAYDWTGFYIGVGVGALQGGSSSSTTLGGLLTPPFTLNGNGTGVLAGLNAGYDFDAGLFVLGVEGEVNFADTKLNGSTTYLLGGFIPLVGNEQTTIGTNGSVTLRAGINVTDNLLVYGKGGLAVGQVSVSGSGSVLTFPVATYASGPTTQFGWVIGVGAEMLATENLSFGLEYTYRDFGTVNSPVRVLNTATPFSVATNVGAHAVQAKMRYRF